MIAPNMAAGDDRASPSDQAPWQLDADAAGELWEAVAEAVDMAVLSAIVLDDRRKQPLLPALLAVPAAKALVGVFASGVFTGLGVGELGKRVGERARHVLRGLRTGHGSAIDSEALTREAEGWVAQMRASSVPEEVVANAEAAVADLLVERGEDPVTARASAQALAQAILDS
jgi:hypothetical protein